MALEWMRRQKKSRFEAAVLEESTEELRNPARGWYEIYTFDAQNQICEEELIWSLRENEELALVLINLGFFREKEIDDASLENIGNILRFFQKNEKDIILRFVYDREGHGIEHEPSTFAMLQRHLGQIGDVLKTNRYDIFLWQGVLVGNWGEMHGSRFLTEKYLKQIKEEICQFLPEEAYFAVRKPAYIRMMQTLEEIKTHPLAVFDDGIFGSQTNLGTYGELPQKESGWTKPWKKEEEWKFLENYCSSVPAGGEVVRGYERSMEEEVEDLRRMHITYLNTAHDMDVIGRWKREVWKQGIFKGMSGYDYVARHMGYRLVVRKVWMTGGRNVENFSEIHINVENIGFANLYQDTEVWLEDERGENKVKCREDGRDFCCSKVVELIVRVPEGMTEYYLICRRKKDGRVIAFANKNADDRVYLGHLQR